MMDGLRFERMALEHRTHTHLRKECLKVGTKAVNDRNEIFRLARDAYLFDKTFERLDIFVKKKADRARRKFFQLCI